MAAIIGRLRQFTGPSIVTTERAAGAFGGKSKLFAQIDSVDSERLVLRPLGETGLLGEQQVIALDRVRRVEDLSSAAARMRTSRFVGGAVIMGLSVAGLIASLAWNITEPDPSKYPGPLGELLYEQDRKRADEEQRSKTVFTIAMVTSLALGATVFVLETPVESKADEWPSNVGR